MVGIYKITNLVNNYIYIGQSIHIETRWAQHKYEASQNEKNSLLYTAMRKDGIDNFHFEVIEECSFEELDEREIYWIKYYNSYYKSKDSKGYNMTLGGQSKLFDPQPFYDLWDEGKTVGEISQILHCSKTTVNGYLQGYKNYSATNSRKRGGILAAQKAQNTKGQISPFGMICQYTLSGELVKKWNSCNEVERELSINACSIGKVINGKRNSAGGFRWGKEGQEIDITSTVNIPKKIGQYDLNNNLIAIYDNAVQAARKFNKNDASNIYNALKGKGSTNNRNTAYGFVWKYLD